MKKNVFLLMALCLNICVAYAQKENPRGTYKMTKLTGRGGVEIDAPFDQYKICEEGMTISVFVQSTSEDEAECRFLLNDPIFFNYTGREPQGMDQHGSQIYDSNGKEFTLRWWSQIQNHPYIETNSWAIEKYEREIYSKQAKETRNLLLDASQPDANAPFSGRWNLLGYARDTLNISLVLKMAGKAEVENVSLLYMVVRGGKTLWVQNVPNNRQMEFQTKTQNSHNIGKKTIVLSNRKYDVNWVDDDTFYYKDERGGYCVWRRNTSNTTLYSIMLAAFRKVNNQHRPISTKELQESDPTSGIPASESDSIYDAPNVSLPQFPGGSNAMQEFLGRELHYPTNGNRMRMTGRVMVQYVVEKDGAISHCKVVMNTVKPQGTAESYGLSESKFNELVEINKKDFETEALRAVLNMPRWQPGVHKEQDKEERVRVKLNVPVNFKLQ